MALSSCVLVFADIRSASIAGIVRFTTIVRSTPMIATGADYLYILDPIMTWAHAEPAIGMIAANLPALRPLLEKALNFISTLTSRNKSTHSTISRPNNYLELGALRNDVDRDKGNETRIMEGYAGNDAQWSLSDSESQTEIVRPSQRIRVERSDGIRSDTG